MPPIDIEWRTQADVRRDGSLRPYEHKYSTVHGWVTKLRGTLLDNEKVRREGIREMKAAKAVREWERKHAAELRPRKGSGGMLSFLGIGVLPPQRPSSSSKAVVSRDVSRRSTKKSSDDTVLHFSHRSKPPSRSQSTSRVEGRLTSSRATVTRDRPTPQRRHTEVVRRPSHHHPNSMSSSRPTGSREPSRPRTTTRRSTRP